MPDSTTPEDHLADSSADFISHRNPARQEDTPEDWVLSESASAETLPEPELDDAGRAEVAAFRSNLDVEVLDEDSVWLADDEDRIGDESRAPRRLIQPRVSTRPPGPGIPEAIAWMMGVMIIHFIGGLVAGAVIMTGEIFRLAETGTMPPEEMARTVVTSLPRLIETYFLELIVVEMLVFLVAAVLATRLRLGARTSHLLGIRPLAVNHFLLITAVSIPISLMCGGFHQMTTAAWDQWFAHLPGMSVFDEMDVNETIKPLGESAPIGLLLLAIAVAPAIGEEVIFRGIIGRGLVARHGVVAGVIMTSLMFAAVHMHPAHVVALLPLAFFIHLVYLTTRSILAPMLLHLLNNSLAVVLLKVSATMPGLEEASEPDMPAYVLLISAGLVGIVGWTLWRSRVQYRTEDGSLWNPGYMTVEIPPESAGAMLAHARCPDELYRGVVGMAGAYSLVFIVILVLMLTGHVPA